MTSKTTSQRNAPARLHVCCEIRQPIRVNNGRKGRNATTLVFDIDGDHLPGVDPDTIAYPDMLERGREEVLKLIELLESDFGFSDFDVFFSGGRGYHVHVYDDGVEALSKKTRGKT